MNIIETVLEYLRHSSSWKGIFSILTAIGVSVVPEFQELVITAGLAVIGLIQFFIDDSDITKKITKE